MQYLCHNLTVAVFTAFQLPEYILLRPCASAAPAAGMLCTYAMQGSSYLAHICPQGWLRS